MKNIASKLDDKIFNCEIIKDVLYIHFDDNNTFMVYKDNESYKVTFVRNLLSNTIKHSTEWTVDCKEKGLFDCIMRCYKRVLDEYGEWKKYCTNILRESGWDEETIQKSLNLQGFK